MYLLLSVPVACISLTVLQLDVPPYVELGSDIHLSCTWELEGKTLYRYLHSNL